MSGVILYNANTTGSRRNRSTRTPTRIKFGSGRNFGSIHVSKGRIVPTNSHLSRLKSIHKVRRTKNQEHCRVKEQLHSLTKMRVQILCSNLICPTSLFASVFLLTNPEKSSSPIKRSPCKKASQQPIRAYHLSRPDCQQRQRDGKYKHTLPVDCLPSPCELQAFACDIAENNPKGGTEENIVEDDVKEESVGGCEGVEVVQDGEDWDEEEGCAFAS